MESFYTIQGEGAHQGRAAYFIRLAGCHVKCVWCDVKDSWDEHAHPAVAVETIVQKAKDSGGNLAVVTGGEPTMHDLAPLTTALKQAGLRTHIETSGAYRLTGTWDWVCFSPKKFMAPVAGFAAHAHELKVVVFHKTDFEWAEKHATQVGPDCQLFLQPEWSKEKEILPLIIEYVKKHPRWQISVQVHKYMNIP
ncbi:MAG: 7-carboxy-7-deazaguanine synthase QueE [Cyclobacteriaceae bacterium]|jgi:organic radical activating enzyme|nr:7-carboxy-7-deazaguanine synthase QueE [Cyclobacteriaceae bacterium]